MNKSKLPEYDVVTVTPYSDGLMVVYRDVATNETDTVFLSTPKNRVDFNLMKRLAQVFERGI